MNTRRFRPGVVLVLSLTLASACKDDEAQYCREVGGPLPASALTQLENVQLVAAGDHMAIAGVAQDTVRWAKVAMSGASPDAGAPGGLGPESTIAVPSNRSLGPFFGLVQASTPADQLVVIYATPKASGTGHDLFAIAQSPGGVQTAPVTVGEIPVTDVSQVRVTAKPSTTGVRTAVVVGIEGQRGLPIRLYVLGGNAALVNGTAELKGNDAPDGWRCLQLGASRHSFTLTHFSPAPGYDPITIEKNKIAWRWRVIELTDDASIVDPIHYATLDSMFPNCPSWGPYERGYVMGWSTTEGYFYIDFDFSRMNFQSKFIAGAVRFGNAPKLPSLMGVAPVGGGAADWLIGFDQPGIPQVSFYDFQGSHLGGVLYMRTAGAGTGPSSSASFTGGFVTTYLDKGAAGAAGTRYLTKVTCSR